MGLFTDGFKLLKKASEPLYKTPKSIQETIEIMAVAENGIFEVSRNKYSKCYRFQDINYTTATEDEQIGIFERYCKFLNSLDCNYKITINNKNKNMEDLRDKVLITEKNDGFNNYRRIYNDIIEEKIIEGRQGIEQERYLTITIERKNFEEAKAQFATLEATIHKAFIELGAEIVPLNGNERLKVLYDYYHLGDEGSFDFDIKKAKKVGADFKNDLCNGMVKYFPDHFEDESKYCKALFIKKYPSSLSDRFINEITSLPVHSITSIDVVPVPKDLTTKVLQKKYLGIESDIIKQQRVRNKNNDFSTEISYAKRTEKKEIEAIMDDVRENDQCLFFVGVTIILMAESKKELESVCETVETIGKRNSCTIDTHYLKQREALNTALPIGVRQVETMRTLLTQSLAVLMPFNVQELNDSTGNYYGINQISKNVNIGNRKKLINGNGFVFGVPGSGKSFFCKMEMGSVFLSGDDEIIVIDPMNEYFDIAQTYGGTVVNMSTYTDNYVNPLEMDVWSLDPNDSKGMIREKGEFMLGLCEQCIGDSLNSRQKSIIDRCVRKMYIDIARGREKYIPVMSDFYDILMEQPEDEAKDIALSLELFVNGSLNIFNHQTNVDVDNRFTVYGIRDLGTELSPITMLVMMESIQNRIVENGQKGKATWLYIDEFHVLLNSEYSAKYLQQLWKKVRKQGGLCTGITQNVVDLLQNNTATTMLANSEFVALLKQANTDSSKMAEVIGVSEAQLRFVTNTASGMGLIKCGSVVIPFDNQISKDTAGKYNYLNPKKAESVPSEYVKEILMKGTGFVGGKGRVCEIYQTEIDAGTRAKRIKAEYGQGGASWPLDGLGLHGYDTFHGSGLRIQWKDEDGEVEGYVSWKNVEKEIGVLILTGEYQSETPRIDELAMDGLREDDEVIDAEYREVDTQEEKSEIDDYAIPDEPDSYAVNRKAAELRYIKPIDYADRVAAMDKDLRDAIEILVSECSCYTPFRAFLMDVVQSDFAFMPNKLELICEIAMGNVQGERKAYCNNQYGLTEYTLSSADVKVSYKNRNGERAGDTVSWREVYEILSYMVKQPFYCGEDQKAIYQTIKNKIDREKMNPVYRKFFDIEDSVRESRLKTRERAIAYGLNTKIDTDGRIISDEDKNVSADISQNDTEPQEAAPETPAQEVLPPVEGLRGKEKTQDQIKLNFHYNLWETEKGGAKTRYQWNIDAICTLKQIEAENRLATQEEQTVLSKFVGWGGLSQAFDENNAAWSKEYAELKELLSDEEYSAARATVNNAFYTSPEIATCINSALVQFGFKGGNVLEPSMGIGNFFGSMPAPMQQKGQGQSERSIIIPVFRYT